MNNKRLESLDILRGFDLFCLVGLEAVMHALDGAIDAPWFDRVMWCFTHVDWEGFSSWDLVMPLFMFMSGITIPFALARYKREGNKAVAYRRIIKRVVLLWLLYGLRAYTGDFYPVLIAVANAAIVYLILRWMYRQQAFLKV